MERRSSAVNPLLDVYLYCGRWQLATADALYSDGDRYRPLRAAFRHIRGGLAAVQDMLLLGTGLGSAVHILHRMGFHPRATLVELDEVVLALAAERMPAGTEGRLTPVCADAAAYMQQQRATYDLVVVDLFIGREVPAFVTGAPFLEQCFRSLRSGGYFVFNYIPESASAYTAVQALLRQRFPGYGLLEFGINKVFVWRKP